MTLIRIGTENAKFTAETRREAKDRVIARDRRHRTSLETKVVTRGAAEDADQEKKT